MDQVDESAEWDERYAESDQLWSGEPNHTLTQEIAGVPVGRALDVGCGEGADAIWLASAGWAVTALDVSAVALERARAHAEGAGVRISWIHAGLLDADLPTGGFDLVSAQYPALRRTPEDLAEKALLAAVAPGGTLLVVHHDLSDPDHGFRHEFDPADWVGPRDVVRALGPGWEIEVDEVRPRRISGGAGAHHARDLVLRARRA